MSSRILARTFHTSLRIASKAAPASDAAPSVRAPRKPSPPKSSSKKLGFSGEKRTRSLPSLSVPNVSRNNLQVDGERQPGQPRFRRPDQQRDGQPGQQRDRQPGQQRDRQSGQQRSRAPREHGRVPAIQVEGAAPQELEIPANFFEQPAEGPASAESTDTAAPRQKKMLDASEFEIPADFFENAEQVQASAPARTRSRTPQDRKPRQQREATGRRDGRQREATGRRDGRKREAASRRDGSANLRVTVDKPTAPVNLNKRDTSPRALFGTTSILSPTTKPSRNPSASFWAKDMSHSAAYKTDTLRRLGDYKVFATPAFAEGKDAKTSALAKAMFVMGNNPTYSLRDAAKGTEALKKFL